MLSRLRTTSPDPATSSCAKPHEAFSVVSTKQLPRTTRSMPLPPRFKLSSASSGQPPPALNLVCHNNPIDNASNEIPPSRPRGPLLTGCGPGSPSSRGFDHAPLRHCTMRDPGLSFAARRASFEDDGHQNI